MIAAQVPPPQVHLVSHLYLGADWRLPRHAHADVNEMILVLAGEIETRINGQVLRGPAGSVLVYPHGVQHEERAMGQPLHLLFVAWQEHFNLRPMADGPFISFDARGRIRQLLEWMHEIHPAGEDEKRVLLSSLFHGALSEFARGDLNLGEDPISRVCAHIKRNFAKEVTLGDLAKMAHQSKHHFARLFRRQVGLAPMRYVRQVRVEAAQALLATSSMPMRTIASRVGLVDEFHLSRVFRRVTGDRPSAIRRKLRREPGGPSGRPTS